MKERELYSYLAVSIMMPDFLNRVSKEVYIFPVNKCFRLHLTITIMQPIHVQPVPIIELEVPKKKGLCSMPFLSESWT